MDTPAPGSRFPVLDDPDFWAAHGSKSDIDIASIVGCHRDTVRLARRRHGITAHPRGRRRGSTPGHEPIDYTLPRSPTVARMLDRFDHESRSGGPAPTEDLLVDRLRSTHEARQAGIGYDDELIGVAVAAMLIVQHRARVRAAA